MSVKNISKTVVLEINLPKKFYFRGTLSPKPPTEAMPLDPTGGLPSPGLPDFYVSPNLCFLSVYTSNTIILLYANRLDKFANHSEKFCPPLEKFLPTPMEAGVGQPSRASKLGERQNDDYILIDVGAK